MLQTARRIKVM